MQPNEQNPYGFILDPSQNKSNGPAFLQDPKKRLILAILFVATVLFLFIIAFAVISSLGKKDTSGITDVAAYQTELLRISTLGLEGAVDPSVLAEVSTLHTFIQSDLTQTTTYLASNGSELTELESASKLDASLEKEFETATLRNSFDDSLLDAIEKTSSEYKLALKNAIAEASSDSEKELLDTAASNILLFEGPL